MVYPQGHMTETASHDFRYLPPMVAALGRVFARPKAVARLCVVVLAALGWSCLGLLAGDADRLLQTLCSPMQGAVWNVPAIAVIASMWCAMTLAMMLPSAAPMILTYAEIADTAARKAQDIVSPFILTAGYAAVWIGFSIVFALTQVTFMQTALSDAGLQSASSLFAGVVFIGAGAYQFSSL
jgi:predicted metal-binding membrane protein